MSQRFVYTHPKQRELWKAYAEGIRYAADQFIKQLDAEYPDVVELEKRAIQIEEDLQALRVGYTVQQHKRPYKEEAS